MSPQISVDGSRSKLSEVAAQKPVGQADRELQPASSLNGHGTHPLPKPKVPSTISERGTSTPKLATSESSGPNCGVRPAPAISSASAVTMNGHAIRCSLPVSPVLKSKNPPDGHKASSRSPTFCVSGGNVQLQTNIGDCVKKSKVSTAERRCGESILDSSCVTKTFAGQKKPSPSSSETVPVVSEGTAERCRSKWNCCANLQRKNRVKTFGCIHGDDARAGSVSDYDSSAEKVRKRDRKLSKRKPALVSSTTLWLVTALTAEDALPHSGDAVHATTTWHVENIASKSYVPATCKSDFSRASQQSESAVHSETVRGGHRRQSNDLSPVRDKSGSKHSTSVGPAVHCMRLAICFHLYFSVF